MSRLRERVVPVMSVLGRAVTRAAVRLSERFEYELRAPVNKLWAYARIERPTPETSAKLNDAWDKAWETLNHDVPKLRAAIENEFRRLLGASPNGFGTIDIAPASPCCLSGCA